MQNYFLNFIISNPIQIALRKKAPLVSVLMQRRKITLAIKGLSRHSKSYGRKDAIL